jgi:drug/metabolite transporter (DMT)-like permease
VSNLKAALAGAILVLGTYVLVLIALAESNVGYVVPLRETSIVFALLLGIFVLREPLSPLRLAAAAVVACGAAAIAIGG